MKVLHTRPRIVRFIDKLNNSNTCTVPQVLFRPLELPCGYNLVVVGGGGGGGGGVCFVDLTSYVCWNFLVPGRATQVGWVVS